MKYINAKTILPESLLKELQRYIQGEILYVPGCEARAGWGEANGTRHKYSIRNKEIMALYEKGASIDEIAESYYLSEYTIRKIISTYRKAMPISCGPRRRSVLEAERQELYG